MPRFALDLYVHDVTISHQLVDRGRRVWCVLLVDGGAAPVSTPALPMRARCDFCRALALPFDAPDLAAAHLFVAVCAFGAGPAEMVPLCRAKTRVAALPLNGPTAFRMPLYSVERPRRPLAYATVSGAIEPVVVAAHRAPAAPAPSGGALAGVRRRVSRAAREGAAADGAPGG
jgi:hypothetical protein